MKMYDSTSEEEFYEEFKERLQVAKSAILEAQGRICGREFFENE